MSKLADLAQASLAAMRSPRSERAIEVHHIHDFPGYLLDVASDTRLLELDSRPEFHPLSETLSMGAYGIGLVAGSRAASVESRPVGTNDRSSHSTLHLIDTPTAGRRFTASSLSSPTFLYQGKAVLEGLVVIDGRAVIPTSWHAQHVKRVVGIVGSIAAHRLRAPLVSVQAPAQVPVRSYSNKHTARGLDDWATSYVTAVRFTIAAGTLTSSERLDALEPLVGYCDDNGFGLALQDPRPSHRSGNWFWVVEANSSRSRTFEESEPRPPFVFAAYPLTFVGPARIGTTDAFMNCLQSVADLGIVTASVSSLSDIAFIHMSIALPYTHYDRIVASPEARQRLRDLPQGAATEVLPTITEQLGFGGMPRDSLTTIRSRAVDYHMFHGPLIRLNVNAISNTRGVWVSMEGKSAANLLHLSISSLLGSFEEVLANATASLGEHFPDGRPVTLPNIDYLIARRTHSGRFRAKGKLTITDSVLEVLYPHLAREARGVQLSHRLEAAWNSRLSAEDDFEVSTAWRENWLGHWLAQPQ